MRCEVENDYETISPKNENRLVQEYQPIPKHCNSKEKKQKGYEDVQEEQKKVPEDRYCSYTEKAKSFNLEISEIMLTDKTDSQTKGRSCVFLAYMSKIGRLTVQDADLTEEDEAHSNLSCLQSLLDTKKSELVKESPLVSMELEDLEKMVVPLLDYIVDMSGPSREYKNFTLSSFQKAITNLYNKTFTAAEKEAEEDVPKPDGVSKTNKKRQQGDPLGSSLSININYVMNKRSEDHKLRTEQSKYSKQISASCYPEYTHAFFSFKQRSLGLKKQRRDDEPSDKLISLTDKTGEDVHFPKSGRSVDELPSTEDRSHRAQSNKINVRQHRENYFPIPENPDPRERVPAGDSISPKRHPAVRMSESEQNGDAMYVCRTRLGMNKLDVAHISLPSQRGPLGRDAHEEDAQESLAESREAANTSDEQRPHSDSDLTSGNEESRQVFPKEVGSFGSLSMEVELDPDLTTDGSAERMDGTAEGSSPSSSVLSYTISEPTSFRVHTPVTVSSPSSSGQVYQEWVCESFFFTTLSGSFSQTHQAPSPLTDSLRHQSTTETGPILAHPQEETGSSGYVGQWSFEAYHLGGSGFPDSSGRSTEQTSSAQVPRQRAAMSSTQPVLEVRGAEGGHADSQDLPLSFSQSQASHGDSASAICAPSAASSVSEAREEDSAPVRLPPITVHAASALPPWATQTALIDLSQADNRPFAQLRTRRATYDEDWPNHSGIDPANMALAGFYRLGPGRRVCCFYCGLQLDHLTSRHNVWDEHVRHCPACPYLLAIMGEDMVRKAHDKLQREGK